MVSKFVFTNKFGCRIPCFIEKYIQSVVERMNMLKIYIKTYVEMSMLKIFLVDLMIVCDGREV